MNDSMKQIFTSSPGMVAYTCACEHIQLLVDSLFDVARTQWDKVELYLEEIDLKQLIEETVSRPMISAQEGVVLRGSTPPKLPPGVLDEAKIKRVLAWDWPFVGWP